MSVSVRARTGGPALAIGRAHAISEADCGLAGALRSAPLEPKIGAPDMAHRELSAEERAVLAHMVLNPEGWWNHICLMFTQAQAESQLSERVGRWKPDYQAAVTLPGYRTRAQRGAE